MKSLMVMSLHIPVIKLQSCPDSKAMHVHTSCSISKAPVTLASSLGSGCHMSHPTIKRSGPSHGR